MNRVDFLESISGIEYPEMLVNFFDQFIALKQLVEDRGIITVNSSDINNIKFTIQFDSKQTRDIAIQNITSNCINIYGKQVYIQMNILDDRNVEINLN